MAKKSVKKVTEKKTAGPELVSPFAAIAVEAASKPVKRVKAEKKAAAKVVEPATETILELPAETPATPAKRTRVKKTAVLELDPFAQTAAASSPVVKKKAPRKKTVKKAVDHIAEIAATEPKVELSPVFQALANVELPPLQKENRARLLMQSPTRAYFYWTIRTNPWQQLKNAFGDIGSYTLVLKLSDLTDGSEKLNAVEAEGEWWFEAEPGHKYEAEIGFYAPNRPYFRIVHSNSVETPRRSPSPRPASDSRWTVSATKFAEVLDASGFKRDAFDVAMAGDDVYSSAETSHLAFSKLVGGGEFSSVAAEEVRYAMLSIASGVEMSDLRSRVSPRVIAAIESSSEAVTPERTRSTLKEYFEIDESEWTDVEFGPAAYGASSVEIPKNLKPRRAVTAHSPRYNPVSSHSIG